MSSAERFFPKHVEPTCPPNFSDQAALALNAEFLGRFPDDQLDDIFDAYEEYKDGALYDAFVTYASFKAALSLSGFDREIIYNGFEGCVRSVVITLWPTCRRNMRCILPLMSRKLLSPEKRRVWLLGYMNLYVNDRVATQSGNVVHVAGRMLSAWLRGKGSLEGLRNLCTKGNELHPWFDELDKANLPEILQLDESPLRPLIDLCRLVPEKEGSSWDVIGDSFPEADGVRSPPNAHRDLLTQIFDAIHYLQAPAQQGAPAAGYVTDLRELHSYSKERYDAMIDDLCASAERAMKAWASAEPEELPCLVEAENWAVCARRVAVSPALVRSAVSLVEQVARACGQGRGRVVTPEGKSVLGREHSMHAAAAVHNMTGAEREKLQSLRLH